MVYRPDIDGLRALAVLGVVIHHAFPTLLSGGFVGVDIFFVISGYLITSILLQEGSNGHIGLVHFYLKRFRRLLPALLVVLVASLIFGWFWLLADEYRQLAKHAVGAGLFIVNFMLLGESGYFDVSSQLKPLLHLWSLGVEEQFYLVWPFLLFWCLVKKRSSAMAMGAILLGSLVLCVYYTYTESTYAFYLPFTRFWELAAGGLLARWHLEPATQVRCHAKFPIAVIGLMLIVSSMLLINKHMAWPGLWAIFPVTGALCLLHSGTVKSMTRAWLTHPWMVWFGLISYPLYLWHWPVLTFARIEVGEILPPFVALVLVLIAVLLAWLTYWGLERPIRQRSEHVTFVPLTGLSLLVTFFALFIFLRDGMPEREILTQLKINQAQLIRMEDDPVDAHAACMKDLGLTGYVRYCNMSGAHPKVALIGDSHARAMYDGLAPYMKARGESLLNVGGRLFLGIDTYLKGSDFERRNNVGSQQATQMVIGNMDIEHVVMFALGPAYISGRTDHVFELIGKPSVIDPLQVWEQGMKQTLTALMSKGKKVTVVLNNPELSFDPRRCLKRPATWLTQTKQVCAITREEFNNRNQAYRNIMKSILAEYPQVKIFDMAQYLCDNEYCSAEKDGLLMYRDDNHLSEAGARFMAPHLYRLIFSR